MRTRIWDSLEVEQDCEKQPRGKTPATVKRDFKSPVRSSESPGPKFPHSLWDTPYAFLGGLGAVSLAGWVRWWRSGSFSWGSFCLSFCEETEKWNQNRGHPFRPICASEPWMLRRPTLRAAYKDDAYPQLPWWCVCISSYKTSGWNQIWHIYVRL